jgi:hypothetical protein
MCQDFVDELYQGPESNVCLGFVDGCAALQEKIPEPTLKKEAAGIKGLINAHRRAWLAV